MPLIASVPEIHDRMHMSDVLEFRKGSGFNDKPNLHPAAPPSSLSSGRAGLRPSIQSPIFVLSSITEHPGRRDEPGDLQRHADCHYRLRPLRHETMRLADFRSLAPLQIPRLQLAPNTPSLCCSSTMEAGCGNCVDRVKIFSNGRSAVHIPDLRRRELGPSPLGGTRLPLYP